MSKRFDIGVGSSIIPLLAVAFQLHLPIETARLEPMTPAGASMIVTIRDVAERAGVSTKTVSRVMNEEAHVRPGIRERVLNVVAEMGYRPNAYARSLSSSRSYLLALLFDDPASGYAIAIQKGASEKCREKNYHLVVERVDLTSSDWQESLTLSLRSLRLDGVILPPPLCQNVDVLSLLESQGVPYVRISPGAAMSHRSGSVWNR